MLKKLSLLFVAAALITSTAVAEGNEPEAVKPNYNLAEQFSPAKMRRMVPQTVIRPNWFKGETKFWYRWQTLDAINYYIVDAVRGSETELWSMAELAEKVTLATNYPFDAQHLPIENMELKEDKYVLFDIMPSKVMVENNDYTPKDAEGKPLKFHFKWDIATKELTKLEEREGRYPSWANVSPDGRIAVYEKNYNLHYMTTEDVEKFIKDPKDSTIVEHAITTDAEAHNAYHWFEDCIEQIKPDERYRVLLQWSPDSKHFATVRSNTEMLEDFWVINILKERPELFSYKYQMPGEQSPDFWLELFNTETMERREVDMAKYKEQMLFICPRPFKHADGYERPAKMVWQGDNESFYVLRQSRDIQRVDLCKVSVATGEVKEVVHEEMETSIEYRYPFLVNGGKEVIEWSERTGWAHLYRYSEDGTLINQITKGDWHISDVLGVDDARKVIYFTATGYNKDENPYYLHLFSVGYDGSGLKQLDPKGFNGQFSLSDDCRYFTTTYSRVDTAPVSELYTTQGKRVMELKTVDMEPLFAAGYKFPEPFVVKAADGITDLHGVMYKPYDFDPNKKYPVIEYIYSGPGDQYVPKTFTPWLYNLADLAELGFIVVQLDGMTTSFRNLDFEQVCYKNLKDAGFPDRIAWMKAAAEKYPYMDLDRVGIYGCSAGGQEALGALLFHGDFYKAAYAACGCHDNRMDKIWWNEQWMGYPIDQSYIDCSNVENAKNLKGKLMLVVGEMDDNVDPSSSYQVVNALIKANKDFEFILLPGARHTMGESYGEHKRYDFFVKNLLGVEPPAWNEVK